MLEGWAFLSSDFHREYHVDDLTAAVRAGAPWTWFLHRVVGLSGEATWRMWRRSRPARPMSDAATDSYLASL
jgi:hypothetical protein